MTSSQLARRAKIIETAIDLIADVGADAVQMRDVAKRSHVALATLYRYFRSKEHLLAAALEDWQKRLTRRFLVASGRAGADPVSGVLDYLRRAQRAFHRNPGMTALMLQTMTSVDPEAKAAIDRMNQTNAELFDRLLEGMAPEVVSNLVFGINAALSSALAAVLTGGMDSNKSLDQVEWVARTLLTQSRRTDPNPP
ncbi:TetR family transcriptional regulator [Nocardia bovistercoris]|uniref:TetR/AcrR family transcriptional regulator n=1 Tax=Nocardia bovistercoris TaxID=2785916 RepID=A0A931IJX0_9NOCA|nr:TetR family transcriptional regulator [Nocardia bovistercoris]MBH0781015.1 TetR/AcrR family transcriptional regulator [Nocardia bovistercoris]